MRLKFRNISIVASAVLTSTLLFTGCGGGGSSDGTTTTTRNTTITGKAVDGYLKSSVVWLDLDADGILDSNEPSDVSDENGNFSLKITSEIRNNPGFPTARIVAEGGVDKDTGKQFNGKLLAPNTGSTEINLSPVTTLVAKLVEKGEDVKKAEEKVKKSLGISEHVDLFDDPKELEKNGDKQLIAAALSLQKSIEMIASAAGGGDEEKAAEIQDKLYEAFAKVLAEETGESTEGGEETGEGVSGLLEAAKKSEALGDVDVDESHLDKAKKLAEEVEKAVEEGHDSGDVEKAATLYTEKSSISGTVTLPDFSDLSELDHEFLIYRLGVLGLENTQALADALLKAGFDAQKLINPSEDELNTLKENFPKVYAALMKEKKEVEEKTDETTATAGGTALALKAGDTLYEVDVDEEDGKLEIEFQTHTLKADGTLEENEKVFVDGEWKEDVDDNDDYILTSQGWVKEKGNETYKINADGSVTINNAFKVSIAKEKDISGKYTLVLDGKVVEIDMPAGAKEYVNTYETVADQYWMWEKERAWGIDGQEYYTSFEEFITHQCGEHWFEGNHEGGVAFAGTDNGDGTYTCDGTATSGKLFEVKGGDETHPSTIVSEDAGTWEIKTVNGVKILFVHPSNPEYSDDHGETIFTEYDGAVWRGEYETAGKKETWHSFNKIAFEAIADYVENMASSATGSSGTSGNQLVSLLGGKTLYAVGIEINDSEIWGDTVVFNADMTELTYTAFDGSEQGTDAIEVHGNKIVWTEDGTYSIVGENKGDYIEVADYDEEGKETSHTRLYFDQAKALAYYNSLKGESGTQTNFKFSADALIGNTLYLVTYDDFGDESQKGWNMAAMSFRADGEMTWEEFGTVDAGNPYNTKYRVTDDGKLVIFVGETGEGPHDIVIEALQKTDDYILTPGGDRLFFDKAKAEAYRDAKNSGAPIEITELGFTPKTVTRSEIAGKKMVIDNDEESIVVKFYKDGTYEEYGKSKKDAEDTWHDKGSWTIAGNYLVIQGTDATEGDEEFLTFVAFDEDLTKIVYFNEEDAGKTTGTIETMDPKEDSTTPLSITPLSISYSDIAGRKLHVGDEEETIDLMFYKDGTYKENGRDDEGAWSDSGSWTVIDNHVVINSHSEGESSDRDVTFITFDGDLQHVVYFDDDGAGTAQVTGSALEDDTTTALDFTPKQISRSDFSGKKRSFTTPDGHTVTFYYRQDGVWYKTVDDNKVAEGSWTVNENYLIINSESNGIAMIAFKSNLSDGVLFSAYGTKPIPNAPLTEME